MKTSVSKQRRLNVVAKLRTNFLQVSTPKGRRISTAVTLVMTHADDGHQGAVQLFTAPWAWHLLTEKNLHCSVKDYE